MKAALMSKIMALGLRLGVTALAIVVIGALIVWLGGGGEVPETQADIVAMQGVPRTQTVRFKDALRQLGHDEPLALELNGNRVFFSTRQVAQSPARALCAYQREFVRQGLNAQAFCDLGPAQTTHRKRGQVAGNLVPTEISASRVVMSGVEMRDGSHTPLELMKSFDPERPLAQLFGAYRTVEIYREADAAESTVLAMWSDEAFDYSRMMPLTGVQAQRVMDPRVPLCVSCALVNRTHDVGARGLHRSFVFTTRHSISQVEAFFRAELPRRGWVESNTRGALDLMSARVGLDAGLPQVYYDPQTMLELSIYPLEPRGTGVRVVLMDHEYLQHKKLLALLDGARPTETGGK